MIRGSGESWVGGERRLAAGAILADGGRAKREQLNIFQGSSKSRGQNLAFTVLHVPYSLDGES